jgi:hypothetical protein
MRVKFDGGNFGLRIAVGDCKRFASGGGAAVEDVRSSADKRGDEL